MLSSWPVEKNTSAFIFCFANGNSKPFEQITENVKKSKADTQMVDFEEMRQAGSVKKKKKV